MNAYVGGMEEENRLQDRLVAAVVHGKLGTEGNQKSEKLNKK